MFTVLFTCTAMCLWLTATFGPIRMRVANVVLQFAICALLSSAALIFSTVGIRRLFKNTKYFKDVNKSKRSIKSDLLRAVIMILVGPAVPVIFILSATNQMCRRLFTKSRFIPTKKLTPADRNLWITKFWYDNWQGCRTSWKWTPILVNVMYVGIVVVGIVVGVGKATTILMSWINEMLAPLHLAVVVTVYMAVALAMFLIPVVPGGIPYCSAGIVVTKKVMSDGGGSFASFINGVIIACASCWIVKMMSITIQHKVIGQQLNKYVSVRSLVGVNSMQMRAMGLVLGVDGLSMAKLFWLVAGPDWPTTVLTGILGLPFGPVFVGSSPAIILIAPTVFAAAALLQIESSDDLPCYGQAADPLAANSTNSHHADDTAGLWLTISTLCIAFTVGVQVVFLILGGFAVSKVLREQTDFLQTMPVDEDVKAYDEQAKQNRLLKDATTDWETVPCCIKIILKTGAATMCLSIYLVLLMPGYCFVPYSLTDTIACTLGNNVLNAIQPVGWVAIGLFGLSYMCLECFNIWALIRVKSLGKQARDQILLKVSAEQIMSMPTPTALSSRNARKLII